MGFPYTYGDELDEETARQNFKLFIEKYGYTLCVNGLLFLFSKSAYAADKGQPASTPDAGPKPGKNVEPHPAKAPVFTPILTPTKLVNSKLWAFGGVGAITWICITAASTGSPALIFACSSIILYAIGANE